MMINNDRHKLVERERERERVFINEQFNMRIVFGVEHFWKHGGLLVAAAERERK
jgi:hypothetical protein